MTLSASTNGIIAYIDGGSRGNPGPAAYGVVVKTADGSAVARLSGFLGRATNNFAEYQGLLAALRYAIEHGHSALQVVSDSELLVRQIKGSYKVKSPDLKLLHEEALRIAGDLESFTIRHVAREENREADRLANEAMDAAGTSSKTGLSRASSRAPLHAAAVFRQGRLELEGHLPLDEGETVDLEILRKG